MCDLLQHIALYCMCCCFSCVFNRFFFQESRLKCWKEYLEIKPSNLKNIKCGVKFSGCYEHRCENMRSFCKSFWGKQKKKKRCIECPLKPLSCYLNYSMGALRSIRSSAKRRKKSSLQNLAFGALVNTCIYWHLTSVINFANKKRNISLNSIFGSTVKILSRADVKCRTQCAGEQAGRMVVP